MPSRLEFQLDMGRNSAGPTVRRAASGAMRLLLLGDFGGEASRPALKDRRVHRVDIDLIDTVLQRVAPVLTLQVGGQACRFAPQSLDDFHPDHLLASLPPLATALDRLRRLRAPATFAQAAAEMGMGVPPSPAPTPASSATPQEQAAPGNLLDQLLGGSIGPARAAVPAPAPPAQGIDALVRSIVGQQVVAAAPANQAAYLAAAQDELTSMLRAVLHAPAFQALEAAWRGLHFLVSRLDLDDALQLHLLDASRAELLADVVAAGGRIEQTGLCEAALHRWCAPSTGQQCGAVIALHEFAPNDTDVGLLAALGLLAARMQAPLVAGGSLTLADDTHPGAAAWRALRASEAAPWVALVAPRLLMRLPHGKGYEATESLPSFEELPAGASGQHLLWGCGALAAAWSLGRAFAAAGWQGDAADEREIDDLPAYTHVHADGDRELQACAEVFLSEADTGRLLSAGLMPLASHRHRNAATLLRWQSVAQPAQSLNGLLGG